MLLPEQLPLVAGGYDLVRKWGANPNPALLGTAFASGLPVSANLGVLFRLHTAKTIVSISLSAGTS